MFEFLEDPRKSKHITGLKVNDFLREKITNLKVRHREKTKLEKECHINDVDSNRQIVKCQIMKCLGKKFMLNDY